MLRLVGTFVFFRMRRPSGTLAQVLLLGALAGCAGESQLALEDYQKCQSAYCQALAEFYNRPIDWRIVLDLSRSYPKNYDSTLALLRKLVDELPATSEDRLFLDSFSENYIPEPTTPGQDCDLSPAGPAYPGGGSAELDGCLHRLFEESEAARRSNQDPYSYTDLPNVVEQITSAVSRNSPGLCRYTDTDSDSPERRQFFIVVTDGDNDPRPTPANPTPQRSLTKVSTRGQKFSDLAAGLFLPRTSTSTCKGFALPVSGATFVITAPLKGPTGAPRIPAAIDQEWRNVARELTPLIPRSFPRELLYVRHRWGDPLALKDSLRKATLRQPLLFACLYPGTPSPKTIGNGLILSPQNLGELSDLDSVAKSCNGWSSGLANLVLPESSLMRTGGKYNLDAFMLGQQPFKTRCRYLVRSGSAQGDKERCLHSSSPQPSTTSESFSWSVIKDPVEIEKGDGGLAGVTPPAVLSLELDGGKGSAYALPLLSISEPQGTLELRILGEPDFYQLRIASYLLLFGLVGRFIFHWLGIKISLLPRTLQNRKLQAAVGNKSPGNSESSRHLFVPKGEMSARAIVSLSTGQIDNIIKPRPLGTPDRDQLRRSFVVDALVLGSEVFLAVWSGHDIEVQGAKVRSLDDSTRLSILYPRSFWKPTRRGSGQAQRHSWEGELQVKLANKLQNKIYPFCVEGFSSSARKLLDIPSLTLMVAALAWMVVGRLTPIGSIRYPLILVVFPSAYLLVFLIRKLREKGLPIASAKYWTPACRITFGALAPLLLLLWFWTDHSVATPSRILALFALCLLVGVGLWKLHGTPEQTLFDGRDISEVEFWMSPALWILPHIN